MAATAESQGKPVPIVYVVDDEEIISQTLAMILNASGFQALAFTDPMEALQSAEPLTPALLISDVMMPEITGIELGIRFRTLYPNCKVLLFSGQMATADLLETAKRQGYDFEILSKPIHPKDLLAAIKRL